MSNETTTTIEDVITGELVKLDLPGETPPEVVGYKEIHALKIHALREEAEALPPITDKATLQANQDVLTKLTRTRTGIDKWRKSLFEPWAKLKAGVDSYLGTGPDSGLQAQIKAIEAKIEAKKKAWNDALEAQRLAAEKALNDRNDRRVKRLLESGMTFTGTAYVIDNLTASPGDINFCTDEQFEAVMAKLEVVAKAKREREAAEEAEQQRLLAEKEAEEAEMRAAFERQKEAQRKLDEDRAALDRERDAVRNERIQMRLLNLADMGLRYQLLEDNEGLKIYATEHDAILYSMSVLTDTSIGEWNNTLLDIADAVEKIRSDAKMEADAAVSMSKSSGISDSHDEVLVQETQEFLADKDRVQALSDAINATRVEDMQEPPPADDQGQLATNATVELESPITMESAIFIALGEASMCWDPIPSGIFDSTRAKEIGDRLVATLKALEGVNFGE